MKAGSPVLILSRRSHKVAPKRALGWKSAARRGDNGNQQGGKKDLRSLEYGDPSWHKCDVFPRISMFLLVVSCLFFWLLSTWFVVWTCLNILRKCQIDSWNQRCIDLGMNCDTRICFVHLNAAWYCLVQTVFCCHSHGILIKLDGHQTWTSLDIQMNCTYRVI